MDKNQTKQQKAQKQIRRQNVLEALKEVGNSTGKSVKEDLLRESAREFMNQILGMKPRKKFSGDMEPGKEIVVNDVKTGKQEQADKLKKQLGFERQIRQEEKNILEKQNQNLRLELHAITTEIAKIAHSTPQLARQVEIATIQAPANPGVYHLIFFERILEFVRSFRKNIESANAWLGAANKRAQKKTFWGQYKKHGGKRLLSSEDYLQRSAG